MQRHPATRIPRAVTVLSLAIPALIVSGPAHAGATRSAQAVPAPTRTIAQPAATSGPRGGFPATPGLARALERANANAAFRRTDSPG